MGKPVNRKARLQKETIRRLSPVMLSMAVGGEQEDPNVEPSHLEPCFFVASPEPTRTNATNTCQG
jgi:hypothetical protein